MDTMKNILVAKVDKALDAIRPHLVVDGGNIEVVDITAEKTVQVRLLGACETCPMSAMTMKAGVEQTIKAAVPEIQEVVAVA